MGCMRCGAAINAENYVETWTLLCKPCDTKFHEEQKAKQREEVTPEQIVSKWIETEWLSHDPAIKDAEEAIVAGLVADIKAAVEAEREACAKIAQEKLDRINALFKSNPSNEGFAYSSVTAADIRDAISKRARSNASNHSSEPAEK